MLDYTECTVMKNNYLPQQFPAVTFCNMNPFRKSNVEQNAELADLLGSSSDRSDKKRKKREVEGGQEVTKSSPDAVKSSEEVIKSGPEIGKSSQKEETSNQEVVKSNQEIVKSRKKRYIEGELRNLYVCHVLL